LVAAKATDARRNPPCLLPNHRSILLLKKLGNWWR
jgi:hypothetical protein